MGARRDRRRVSIGDLRRRSLVGRKVFLKQEREADYPIVSHPPVEDDTTGESGMNPEIEVDVEEAYEDLNVQPITMNRTSDSPHPPSPRQAAALDRALDDIDINNNEPDFDPLGSVLAEVPSTKPETPPKRHSRESRSCEPTSRPREDTRQVVLAESSKAEGRTDEATSVASPGKGKPLPSSSHRHKSRHERGRGILHLPAPPKVGERSTPERRPEHYGEMLAPTVEFMASTPPLEDSQLFASESENSQFQDADEDYRPLTGTWADTVEREEQANSAAAAAVSAALVSLPMPVAALSAAAGDATMSPIVTTSTVELPQAAPIPIASLLLSSSTTVSESTVELPRVSTGESGTASASSPAAAATALDARHLLQDMDITYAIRLAPAPNAEVTTDALLTSFRSTMSRIELLHIV